MADSVSRPSLFGPSQRAVAWVRFLVVCILIRAQFSTTRRACIIASVTYALTPVPVPKLIYWVFVLVLLLLQGCQTDLVLNVQNAKLYKV